MAQPDKVWPDHVAALLGDPIPVGELGAVAVATLDPLAGCRVVLSAWLAEPSTPFITFERVAELALRYAQRLAATGVGTLAAATAKDATGFVHAPTKRGAPPAVHTMHLRRTVLRSMYRTLHDLGADVEDLTAFMDLPSRWYRTQRPVTDAELHQLRTTAAARRGDPPPGAVLLALAEAGATTAELTMLRWDAIGSDATVALPGVTRVLPRAVPLTEWGHATITRAMRDGANPSALVIATTSTKPPGTQPAIAAMTNRLRQLLRAADLHTTEGIGPRSIRLWAGVRAYRQTGRIEDAAAVLGMRALDRAAAAICLHRLDEGNS
jgi:integrase/recombinase XerC